MALPPETRERLLLERDRKNWAKSARRAAVLKLEKTDPVGAIHLAEKIPDDEVVKCVVDFVSDEKKNILEQMSSDQFEHFMRLIDLQHWLRLPEVQAVIKKEREKAWASGIPIY